MEGMDTAGRANDEHFSIRESLAGHSVLLTGATGYLGSLVLEQLLRCVPDINTVCAAPATGECASRTQRPSRKAGSSSRNPLLSLPVQVYVLVRDRKSFPATLRVRRWGTVQLCGRPPS